MFAPKERGGEAAGTELGFLMEVGWMGFVQVSPLFIMKIVY